MGPNCHMCLIFWVTTLKPGKAKSNSQNKNNDQPHLFLLQTCPLTCWSSSERETDRRQSSFICENISSQLKTCWGRTYSWHAQLYFQHKEEILTNRKLVFSNIPSVSAKWYAKKKFFEKKKKSLGLGLWLHWQSAYPSCTKPWAPFAEVHEQV